MLEAAGPAPGAVTALRLAPGVAAVLFDGAAPGAETRIARADGTPIAPLATLRLGRADGGARTIWIMRLGEASAEFAISAAAFGPEERLRLDPDLAAGDPLALVAGLDGRGRLALLSAALNAWPGAFRLGRSRVYAATLGLIARSLQPRAAAAIVACRPFEGLAIIEATLSSAIGRLLSAHVVGSEGLSRLKADAALGLAGPRRRLAILADHGATAPGDLLVLIGETGAAVRPLEEGEKAASLAGWWTKRRFDPALAGLVVRGLSARSEAGRRAVLELQARAPLPARAVAAGPARPMAVIDLALSLEGGLLAGGFLDDPDRLVAGLDHLLPDGGSAALETRWHRFSGRYAEEEGGATRAVTGFVAFLPEAAKVGPLLQPRFRLRLASGTALPLVPRPQPTDPAAMRAAALRAVPVQNATAALLAEALHPALAEIQKRAVAPIAVERAVRFGTGAEAPLVSLVVPLYRVLDFLRFQFAAFATDTTLRQHGEIVYVLDSPDQAEEAEHLLGGLFRLYRMPVTLAVLNGNGGFARASNAGADLARGRLLGLVNSDVIPIEPGWALRLAERIGGKQNVGAVGPKLLFEDGALQHAGLYFERDARGTWLNHHYHKGLPAGWAAANRPRLVPAVTGACLLTTRSLFREVGGFTEDYVIGDYEDSDLCLKIRATGRTIGYEPRVALYHLERRSIRRHADYMRGIASRYNSWLHGERWDAEIRALMGETAAEAVRPVLRKRAAAAAAERSAA
ncbi:glycosyltransferase [Prosthecomicrobium pneumaticum]|uniref:GT2 family glycosyltransferase n=1 Tax=Prosthecomicrobium pneumaticum TaxID=81895 RepID=A0A7W9FMB0_9HYPH|nr:glycosyltransferase [Prosthecomicrobium pneumaticum]MBB5753221.1 GT2 family glycosyltransferase [Prosthecomicrobium pneumaticum]